MKLKSLKNQEINLNISPSRHPIRNEDECKSKFQYLVGQELIKQYPHYDVLEEIYIPYEKFYLDFFIPGLMIAVEANGEQHDRFIGHFHKEQYNFRRQVERDHRKLEWCEFNDISLINIPYKTKSEEIHKILRNS